MKDEESVSSTKSVMGTAKAFKNSMAADVKIPQ